MWDVVLGAVLGSLVSLVLAEVYYRRSSADLRQQVSELCELNEKLRESSEAVEGLLGTVGKDVALARKHAVIGTTDDPEFPYK